MILNSLSEHLEELTVIVDKRNNTALRCLLPRCLHMKCIRMYGVLEDEHFELIAKHCPQLTSLSVNSWNPDSITEIGALQVLMACPKLKTLAIIDETVSFTSILQAILNNRFHLEKLSCDELAEFSSADVQKFRSMAREMQLLPVPMIK